MKSSCTFATAAALAAAFALSSAYAADTNMATKTGTPDKGTQSSVNAAPPSTASNSAATDQSTTASTDKSTTTASGSSYSSNASNPNYEADTTHEKHGFFHKLFHPSEWGKSHDSNSAVTGSGASSSGSNR